MIALLEVNMVSKTKELRPFAYNKARAAKHTDVSEPCACCGRKVVTAEIRHWIHVVGGGIAYGGEEDTGDGGDMGWFPVGATCAKRLRAAGIFVQENT